MIEAMLKQQVDRFERTWGYPSDYMRRLIEVDAGAAIAFWQAAGLAQRNRGVPPAGYLAAKLAAALHEDCGPCAQLAVDMALKAKVPAAEVRAMVVGDLDALSEEARLGLRFARAVLARDLDAQAEPRREIVERWGEKALVSLALAIAGVRLFPTVKQALGFGATCQALTVGGERVVVRSPPLAAAA